MTNIKNLLIRLGVLGICLLSVFIIPEAALADCDCPLIFGSCDSATIRDLFIPDSTSPMATIRMKFNVMCDDYGNNCAASQAMIDSLMARTAAVFEPARIDFEYSIEYINNSYFLYAFYSTAVLDSLKYLYADDPEHQYNVYIKDTSAVSIAKFPWSGVSLTYQGGIDFKTASISDDFQWHAHELGHSFGIWHVWQGELLYNCDPNGILAQYEPCYEYVDSSDGDCTGDFCSDTRPGPKWQSCEQPDSTLTDCAGTPWGEIEIYNIMSYCSDTMECRDEFTPQQCGRMRCWINSKLICYLDIVPGDVNGSGVLDISDLIYLVDHVNNDGPAPVPLPNAGDFDCSGGVDADDVYYLSDYMFNNGPAPECCTEY
ncbi:MAG: hypothetical protein AB1746_07145 [Candidatus Zixiibacteriota bacterium]